MDSAVAGALVHRAIGDQLTCIFVDHGLLRKDEGAQVERAFRDYLKANFIHVQAEERFLARLTGVTEPEQKRKIIGNEFVAGLHRRGLAHRQCDVPRARHALPGYRGKRKQRQRARKTR